MKSKSILLLLIVSLSACDFNEEVKNNYKILNKDMIQHKESKANSDKKLIMDQDINNNIENIPDNTNYFVSKDLYLDALNSSIYQGKENLLIELYLEEPPQETNPLAILTADEPIVIKKARTINSNKEEYRKVFSNDFEISFLSKNKRKSLNINLSNKEYISIFPTYTDENISMIHVETKGVSLHPEDYRWSSCLYLYHKQSNKIMDFYPEGCVFQDIKRTGVTEGNNYERYEVYLHDIKIKDGIYTISINNIPRLQNSRFDFSKEKIMTYKFKLNLNNKTNQFQLVYCDYRYKKSNRPIKEYRECDYSLDWLNLKIHHKIYNPYFESGTVKYYSKIKRYFS